MSPRRHRRAADASRELDDVAMRRGIDSVQSHRDGDWIVRNIPGGAATKAYRCPGCDQEIRAGVAHLVVWPADDSGGLEDRRHWHTGCWQARDRRGPITQRSRSAPKYG